MLCTSTEKIMAVLEACRPILNREAEVKGLVSLWGISEPLRLCTASQPVRTIEDLKGMRVYTQNEARSGFLTTLGASPIDKLHGLFGSNTPLYMAMTVTEPKYAPYIIEGALFTPSQAISFDEQIDRSGKRKKPRAVEYMLWDGLTASGFGNFGYVTKKAFDALSDTDKKILMEEAAQVEKLLNANIAKSRSIVQAEGIQVIDLASEELKRWQDKAMPLWDKIMANAGPYGKELLAAATQAVGLSIPTASGKVNETVSPAGQSQTDGKADEEKGLEGALKGIFKGFGL